MATKKYQAWVSLVGDMERVVDMARKVFPDAENESELYRRALIGWANDRAEGGKSKKLDALAATSAEIMSELMELKKQELENTAKIDSLSAKVDALSATLAEFLRERKQVK